MNIGQLFVSLGVKGTDKTLGAITNVKKGLKETASVSLEAKAAIIGALYALERLFSKSGEYGTGLTNFNATLGVSTKTLQEYQYAARQVGVSNEEVEGSFKGLQATITKTLMGEGAPKGLARVSMLVGEMTPQDLEKFAKQPQLLIQKLQQYAQKETHAGLRNEVLKSFGLSDGMIAGLTRNAFRPEVLAKAPTYNDREIANLDKANIAWSNLGNKIQMAIGHFNAAHGGQLVNDITKTTDAVFKMIEAFTKLADKAELFKKLGMVFEGWQAIFEGITKAIDFLNNTDTSKNKDGLTINDVLNYLGTNEKGEKRTVAEAAQNATGANSGSVPERIAMAFMSGGQGESLLGIIKDAIAGNRPASAGAMNAANAAHPTPNAVPSGSVQNINVNQNLNFQHDGKDAKKTSDSTKKAVQGAFRQLSAQAQGS